MHLPRLGEREKRTSSPANSLSALKRAYKVFPPEESDLTMRVCLPGIHSTGIAFVVLPISVVAAFFSPSMYISAGPKSWNSSCPLIQSGLLI